MGDAIILTAMLPPTRSPAAAEVVIREIGPDDAPDAARLTGELGYPVSADAMRERIENLIHLPDHVIYVGCIRGRVVAWIHVMEIRHLQAGVRAEIGGFVVSENIRSRGVGSDLLARAESWARSRGLTTMVVRSNVTREQAHRFYLRQGYERTKTSAVFTKQL